ncbi:MAG: 4Fe-4S dicluster domain-containing protein [Desulfobacterales bacterium]|nr:4Fe-4S dicluster domain-containing protein [Desulfobacterales bacterium]
MQEARNLKTYRREVREALENDFLRTAMDNFAVAYRTGRANAFAGMDVDALVADVAEAKDGALSRMDALFEEFRKNAEKAGVIVHKADTAGEANEIIARIARENQVRSIIKSKSMTAEETLLNHHLEADGFEVIETDLGEWIIQLRGEGPSHMVMPAIHLSRHQVADLFTDVTGEKQDAEIERLVKVARRELRQKFAEADMGVSGANFAIADTGTIGLTTNEGNARLVTTLPRVHVALVGLDKLTPTLGDALKINRVLPKNATGQAITSYVTWITGPNECKGGPDNKKVMHIVFLDNGRSDLARDPVFSEVLRCVRCGACANVCPVYRMVGGHTYGHIYIGAIGLIITYFFHGREKARNLVQNCINCGACKAICAAGIDLPRLIKEVYAIIQDEEGHPIKSVLLSKVLKNRKLFHGLLRSARAAQRPVTGGTPYLRHLPQIFAGEHNFRAIPAIAEKPFRDRWEEVKPRVDNPRVKVALFAGCVQDFVYPEQLEAGVRLLAASGAAADFPMDQSCCGLPVEMMGEKESARAVARQNIAAVGAANYDYIVALCASCASHLKGSYPRLLENDRVMAEQARRFSEKVISFSQLLNDVLKVDAEAFGKSGRKATWHAPCHLCRGLGVRDAPHSLIEASGCDFKPAAEEETCCGFGGTWSSKFPRISAEILTRKLDDFQETGAEILLTECPGCVMHLRGGAKKQNRPLRVMHLAEAMADNLKD